MPSFKEFLYGKIAIANHMISTEQLDACIDSIQVLERHGVKKTMGEVLIGEGFISKGEDEIIQQMIDRSRQNETPKPTQQDIIFSRIAVKNKLCSKEQADAAFRTLQSAGVYQDIAAIMIKQGIIKQGTADAIFRAWQKKIDARKKKTDPKDESGTFRIDRKVIKGNDIAKTPWLGAGKRQIENETAPPAGAAALGKGVPENEILLESQEIKTAPIWPGTVNLSGGPQDLESSGVFTITSAAPVKMSPEEAAKALDAEMEASRDKKDPDQDQETEEERERFEAAQERVKGVIRLYCRSHQHIAVIEYFHDTNSNVTSVLKVSNRVNLQENEVKKIFQDFMIGGILRNVSNTVVHFAPNDEEAVNIKDLVLFWRSKQYHNEVLKWLASLGDE